MRFDVRRPGTRGLTLVVLGMFTIATLDLGALAVPAWADSTRDQLSRAEDYVLVADFGTALEIVDPMLASGELSGDALRDAWILKARCELGLAHRSSAADAFCNALRVDSQWEPDPDFYTKDEQDVFRQARENCAVGAPPGQVDTGGTPVGAVSAMPAGMSRDTRPWYKKPLYLGIIGGAVVLGTVLLLSGGDDDEKVLLPDFPAPPAN
jgi:hypothetical protein